MRDYNRRNFLATTGLAVITGALVSACGAGAAASGGGIVVVPAPTSTATPAPTPTSGSYLTIAFAGSSSPAEYLSTYTGPASSDDVLVSQDGTTFGRLEVGAFGKTAGIAIAQATGKKVRYLAAGVGGTTLQGWAAQTSSLRANLVASLRAAGGADIILLQVGRNDAAAGVIQSPAAQTALLRSLIAAIRSEGNVPNAMIFIGGSQEILQDPAAHLQIGWQRQAEMTVANSDANVRFGYSTYDLPMRDGIHQTEPSQIISGGRFAAQAIAWLNGGVQARGPMTTAFRAASDTETDVTLALGNSADVSPSSDISGFTITSNGRTLAILKAERRSPTSIRLTHDARGGAKAVGSYALFTDVDGAQCLRGTGPLQLPAEPSQAPFSIG